MTHLFATIEPAYPMANFNLGLYELDIGNFEGARRHLDKAVKKCPAIPAP